MDVQMTQDTVLLCNMSLSADSVGECIIVLGLSVRRVCSSIRPFVRSSIRPNRYYYHNIS